MNDNLVSAEKTRRAARKKDGKVFYVRTRLVEDLIRDIGSYWDKPSGMHIVWGMPGVGKSFSIINDLVPEIWGAKNYFYISFTKNTNFENLLGRPVYVSSEGSVKLDFMFSEFVEFITSPSRNRRVVVIDEAHRSDAIFDNLLSVFNEGENLRLLMVPECQRIMKVNPRVSYILLMNREGNWGTQMMSEAFINRVTTCHEFRLEAEDMAGVVEKYAAHIGIPEWLRSKAMIVEMCHVFTYSNVLNWRCSLRDYFRLYDHVKMGLPDAGTRHEAGAGLIYTAIEKRFLERGVFFAGNSVEIKDIREAFPLDKFIK